ncbi:MAG: hypothetical protein D6692_01755, partial [Planctomycetota bacterium]
ANQQAQLAAQQSNQQAGLQAGLANQQAGLQAGLANQQAGLQAGLANQQAQLAAQQSNQAADRERFAQEAAQRTQVSQFNAGQQQARDLAQAQLNDSLAARNQAHWQSQRQLEAQLAAQRAAQQAGLEQQAALAQFAADQDRSRFNTDLLNRTGIYNVENFLRNRAENRAYAGNAANLLASTAQDPMLAVLGRSSVAPGMTPSFLGMQTQYQGTPQLFNPYSSDILGIIQGNAANQMQASIASANNRSSLFGSIFDMIGSVVGLGG